MKVYGMNKASDADAMNLLDEETQAVLSMVEEVFNKTDFMNRSITFPGGRTILGSEVFDHLSAYHYFTDPQVLGPMAGYVSEATTLETHAPASVNPFLRNLNAPPQVVGTLNVDAKSIVFGSQEGVFGSIVVPTETRAQLLIHEIIHGAADASGAMPITNAEVEALRAR